MSEARRRRNNVGDRRLRLREERLGRINEGAHQFGGRDGSRLEGAVVIEHPTRKQRLGGFLDPLVDQNGDFFSQIRSVREPSQFVTLQRGTRRRLEIVERRSESSDGHGRCSNLGLVLKRTPIKLLAAHYKLS